MGIEIERKYLILNDQWRNLVTGSLYCQGYISHNPTTTVRVRIANETGFLTLKGPSTGIVRPEFEYEIPITDAQEMLQLWCGKQVIEKYRYRIPIGDLIWEVDEFLGRNQGLLLAEVELETADQSIAIPEWIGAEVTGDIRYYNSYLVEHPYTTWQDS